MNTLHIFNPETDFALAADAEYYTPPKNVVALRRCLALTPVVYARRGDFILLQDRFDEEELRALKYFELLETKGVKLLGPDSQLPENVVIRPWGWNLSLRRFLINKGIPEQRLPSGEDIANLRKLSHRRTTIPFLSEVYTELGVKPAYPLPIELTDEEEVAAWCENNPGGYLKAPWSSSGRGVYRVLRTGGDDILGWVRGTIRRQGSLMAEPRWNRVFDFATEWMVDSGVVTFIGYSVFNVDDHSQYTGNIEGTQQQLEMLIKNKSAKDRDMRWLESQKHAIAKLIAPYYSGPLGIDCLIDDAGNINPCVEINMRMTMGMLRIL